MKKLLLASGLWLLAVMPARLLFILLMAGWLSGVEASIAQDKCIPDAPSPFRLVNNFSKEFPDFFSTEEEQLLEQKLDQFSKSTSNQIVIVIVDDLCGYDANEFSTRLGQAWGVGQGKFDNGVVVMIKPTGGAGQRKAYIAVGYGLEGVIPDIAAKQIVEREIIPYFKMGKNYNALNGATDVLIGLAKKEFIYADYNTNPKVIVDKSAYFGLAMMLIIIVLTIIFRKRTRSMTISGGRTYYGSSWGGGSWSSGRGRGGFSGFGGGGFGGGGAGGSW